MDADELIDDIRQVLGVEAEEPAVLSILSPPTRRAKPGGLRFEREEGTARRAHSPGTPRGTPPAPGTGAACAQLVLAKAKRTADVRHADKPRLSAGDVERLFRRRAVPAAPVQPPASLAAQLVAAHAARPPAALFLNQFVQFEATSQIDSKTIKIVYAFADQIDGVPPSLDICVKTDAKIRDFIGLCLQKYSENQWTPAPDPDLRHYNLYLADDLRTYDTDLPALDAHRPLADIGFQLLALVREADEGRANAPPPTHHLQVYFVDGSCIPFELDDLDKSVEWLKTEALRRREEERRKNGIRRPAAFDPNLTQYRIEAAELCGQALKAATTLSAAGTRAFLVLRENSARGAFRPPSSPPAAAAAAAAARPFHDLYLDAPPLFVEARTRPADLVRVGGAAATATAAPPRRASAAQPSPRLDEFFVERIHRLKPKWTAKLTFRDDCITLVPIDEERPKKTFVQATPPKTLTISWDLIGGICYTEKSGSKRDLRLVWLPMSVESFALQQHYLHHFADWLRQAGGSGGQRRGFSLSGSSSAMGLLSLGRRAGHAALARVHSAHSAQSMAEPQSPDQAAEAAEPQPALVRDLIRAYDQLAWKTVNLETTDDEAWRIGTRINDILDDRRSPVRMLFQESAGGERRPAYAADVAFRLHDALQHCSQGRPADKSQRRRFSVNPMPIFSRILSRHD